jgi:hypothetical protein
MTTPSLAHAPGFSPDSRVWVYVTERTLTDAEAALAQAELSRFVKQWTAHNNALQAAAEVWANNFLILMVDETRAGASGCSIDKSVHFLEDLGARLGVDCFARTRFAWQTEGGLQLAPQAEFAEQVKAGAITQETPVVNSLAQRKADLAERWWAPLGQSWHRRLV